MATEVGTYYITVMPSMNKFTGAIKSAMGGAGTNAGKTFTASFGDVVMGSALGQVIGRVASALGGELMEGLGKGIQRLDTLENFPKVMESLGYNADEAQQKIKLIADHLDGLPTATNDVVTLTQAIADSTGDLDLATRAALGFNDMMLANGNSTAEVTQAQGVLNRVLGKGSATVAQWQSLTSVMPAQLNLVAEHMLGAGASSEQLHTALEDGTVSWNDFLRAIAELDEQGTGSIKSFHEQAIANSKGIGTALENIPNRIGAGWAEILKAIGREDISGAIDSMSYGIRDAMKQAAEGVTYLKDAIANTSIGESLQRIGEGFKGVIEYLSPSKEDLKAFADALVAAVDSGLKWLADNGELVSSVLAGIGGAVAVIVGLQFGQWLVGVQTAMQALWAVMAANPIVLIASAIAAVVTGLIWFFTETETGKAIWEGFCQILSDTWAGLQEDWAAFCEVCTREWESFQAFLDGIPEWWQGIVDYWTGALEEFGTYMAEAWDKLKSDLAAAWENINKVLTDKLNSMAQGFVQWGDGICSTLASAWSAVTTAASNAWTNIKTFFGNTWDAIKATFEQKVEVIATYLSNKWDNIKNTASNVWNGVKEVIGGVVDGIKALVTGDFDAIGEAAHRVWDGIRMTIEGAINGARDAVGYAVDAIKGFFNFEFTWPHIPLPHINYSLIEVPVLGTIPDPTSLSIDWYAKGGVFDTASIIGIGEKGREAALPLNDAVYQEMARGIVRQMGSKGGRVGGVDIHDCTFNVRKESDIDAIAEALSLRWEREGRGQL